MRRVNQQIKGEIEEHMDFHLKIDQANTPRLKKNLSSLRLRSCHIVHFNSRKIIRNAQIFANPGRIKKLTFDGVVSTTNLHRILNQCSKVECLVFTHQTLGIDRLIEPTKFDHCMRKLDSLNTLDLQLLRYPQGDPFETEENIDAFLRATFANLKSFRLCFSLWGNFTSLLGFLERHRKTLKELELQVGDRGDSQNTESYLTASPMTIEKSVRLNLMSLNLTKFCFRDDVLNLNNTAKDLILSILMEQRQLKVLHFHTPEELSWNMLSAVISANENSLTEVVVYNLQSSIGRARQNNNNNNGEWENVQAAELNMNILSKCTNLKSLVLSCSSSNGNDPNVVGSVIMKMANLHLIPTSIERLHLNGFTLDAQELVSLTERVENRFKEVIIADAGTMKYSDVLCSFLKNCANLSYLNVRPVVLQAANEPIWWKEVGKLTMLYERFMGIQYDPIDDLEGFEANISDSDKEWIKSINPEEA